MRVGKIQFYKYSSIFVFTFSFLLQLFLIGKYLDNQVVSSYAPTAIDAADYVGRASLWNSNGFTTAFSDAYRMPGYPLIILIFQETLTDNPYLALKVFQVILFSLSVLLIKSIVSEISDPRTATWVSFAYAILPIWHFTPVILAESLTTVLFTFTLFLMTRLNPDSQNIRKATLIGLLVSALVYLKPNNLMLLVSIVLYVLILSKKFWIQILANISLVVFLAVGPWMLLANHVQPGFIGLTTNSGGNLYTGTGMILDYNGSWLAKSATRWQVDPNSNPRDLLENDGKKSAVELNTMYTEKAVEIWMKRPLSQIRFGIDKVLIAFGLKSNSLSDYALGLITLGSFIGSLLLFTSIKYRPLGASLICFLFLLAIQAFVFQADRRFVVTILFPFFAIAMGAFIEKGKTFISNRYKTS